jgi:hypothetical protein
MSLYSGKLLAILVVYAVGLASSCNNNTSCDSCLGENCVWVPVEGCLETCDVIADTACYDIQFFPNSTVEEICILAMDCEDHDTCDECLEDMCSWAPSVGCLESCDVIADTPCFVSSNTSTTIEETCMASEESVADEMICTSNLDCGTCVGTLLSDGMTTCQWFEEGAYCSSGCGIMGCGTTSCSEATTSASRSPTVSADRVLYVGVLALIFIYAPIFG